MESLISIKNLTKHYGGKAALSNVSLEIPSGCIVGLLGPNGSGKTTLIKIMNGLLHNYQGEVLIDGHKPDEHTKALVSYLPDRGYLGDWMTAKDAFRFFRDFYQDFDETRAYAMLSALKLSEKQKIKSMSKGMQEKIHLILVMSRKARFYVLDEPIGGVDPAARDYIIETIMTNYLSNATLMISTHLITDVEKIFNRVIFLKEGNIVLYDEVNRVREQHNKSIDELFREVFR